MTLWSWLRTGGVASLVLLTAGGCHNSKASSGSYNIVISGALAEARSGKAKGEQSHWFVGDDFYLSLDLQDPAVPITEYRSRTMLFAFHGIPKSGTYRIHPLGEARTAPFVADAMMTGVEDPPQMWSADSGVIRVSDRKWWRYGLTATFDVTMSCMQACPCPTGVPCNARFRGRVTTR